jgi:uncharacterized surface protein with fasciclin (FAS1) repeats
VRRLILTLAATAAAIAVTAVPAPAKAERTTITDTVLTLSGTSGFDTNHGDFDILREALKATGLDGALDGRGQFTVFAPPDSAFLALTGTTTEQDAFNAVAALGLDNVRSVLLYHVTRGARTAEDVVPATRLRTLNGAFLTKESGSAVLRDGAGRDVSIVAPDAAIVSNGVIHVVGGVLLPFAL